MARIREELTFIFPVCECSKEMEYASYDINSRIHTFRCPACKKEKHTDNVRDRFVYSKEVKSA